MKAHFYLSLILWLVSNSLFASVPEGVNLAKLDTWNIVIPEKPVPAVAYAAEEFRCFFKKASGLDLPVVKKIKNPENHIFIGCSEIMKKSAAGFDVKGFGSEDLRIVIRNKNIAIAGGNPRGTLYGVYTFLEDYLGVRFLTIDHTHVPPVGQWRMAGPVDRFYHPPLKMRPLVSRFLELCKKYNVDRAREHNAFSEDRARLLKLLKE